MADDIDNYVPDASLTAEPSYLSPEPLTLAPGAGEYVPPMVDYYQPPVTDVPDYMTPEIRLRAPAATPQYAPAGGEFSIRPPAASSWRSSDIRDTPDFYNMFGSLPPDISSTLDRVRSIGFFGDVGLPGQAGVPGVSAPSLTGWELFKSRVSGFADEVANQRATRQYEKMRAEPLTAAQRDQMDTLSYEALRDSPLPSVRENAGLIPLREGVYVPSPAKAPTPSEAAGTPSPAAPPPTATPPPVDKDEAEKSFAASLNEMALSPADMVKAPGFAKAYAEYLKTNPAEKLSRESFAAEYRAGGLPEARRALDVLIEDAANKGKSAFRTLTDDPVFDKLPYDEKKSYQIRAELVDLDGRVSANLSLTLKAPVKVGDTVAVGKAIRNLPADEVESALRSTEKDMLGLSSGERDRYQPTVTGLRARLSAKDPDAFSAKIKSTAAMLTTTPADLAGRPMAIAKWESWKEEVYGKLEAMAAAAGNKVGDLDTFSEQIVPLVQREREAMSARLSFKNTRSNGFETTQAETGEHIGYEMSTILAAITTGIGLYSALVQTPKSQKDAQNFELKMMKERMEYEQNIWDRNVAYANSRSSGGSSRSKRQPSAVAPVRF